MADLDALLDEAASTIKPAAPKKKVDPPAIRPYLAATALVDPETRDRWSSYVRRDHEVEVPVQFMPSDTYQKGDSTYAGNTSNKVLSQTVLNAAQKCALSDPLTNKMANLVNPVTDNELGKQLQLAYKRLLLKDLKRDILKDPNYDAAKYPNLAAMYAD
jgi:hypothetical protein